MTTVAEQIEHLRMYKSNRHIACIIWTETDVMALDSNLSEEDANRIIDSIHRRQRADLGINWDTLQLAIDEFHVHKGEE